ncbi:hypothetical protein ACLMJK_009249 [Lecanora helva]
MAPKRKRGLVSSTDNTNPNPVTTVRNQPSGADEANSSRAGGAAAAAAPVTLPSIASMTERVVCQMCRGSGKQGELECAVCGGKGNVVKE